MIKYLLKKFLRPNNGNNRDSLITINISRSAILHNLIEFKKLKPRLGPSFIAPVLKSNAYGHGLVEIANILEKKVDFIIIDSYFEALTIRNNYIDTPLLVIGYVKIESIENNKLRDISYTIGSMDILYSLKRVDSKVSIHLKIDTGMNRQGIAIDEINEALNFIKLNPYINLVGICSHLADADNNNDTFTQKQITLWNNIVKNVRSEFPNIKYTHLSNTYGHKFSNIIDANTSRLGIGLYGLADIPGLQLKPALEMKTIITGVKNIKKGDSVGYNNTFIANSDMRIATIPVGYYEGLDRRLSNKGFVKVGATLCPIIGRVSMNITTIDVSGLNIGISSEVTVVSNNTNDINSIYNMSKICGPDTIPYELTTHIQNQLKRIVVE